MTIDNERTVEVGIVTYPGAQLSAVLGMTDLFTASNRFMAPDERQPSILIRVSHWKLDEGSKIPVRTFDTMPSTRGRPDVLILPPTLEGPASPEIAAPFVEWLREHHASGTVLASVCAGAFLLGETGLLDGRSATTHWMHEDLFRARFPKVWVDVDRLLIDGGEILCAGGLMAWTDLCLKLLDRFRGAEVMAQTAKFLLVDPPGREQRYYSFFSPRLAHGDAAVLKVQRWLQATEAKDISLEALAAEAGLERRTFLRRFRKATGMTTSEYGQRLRVSKACELLQFSGLSVEQIAWQAGYTDPGAFRKVFARVVGLTPSEYRQRFNTFEARDG
ncbi:GlxA family transcriptional regulator [Microvirga makkahensis]